MSQQGYVAWYTNSSEIDLVSLLKELPRVVGFDHADFVSRHPIVSSLDDSEWNFDEVDEDPTASELYRLYKSDTVLHINADFAELGERIERGVLKHIPAEIRGDFMPNRPFITIGAHFWSDSDLEEQQTPCRAMVGCWGYSTPNDGAEFKRRIASMPEVDEERKRLEAVMGPTRFACFFSF